MEMDPLCSEVKIEKFIPLPLCKNEDYIYLLSGSRWRVLDNEIVDDLISFFESEDKELVYLPDIFNSLRREVLSYNFPGVQFPEKLFSREYEKTILKRLQLVLWDGEYLFIRYSKEESAFMYYRFTANDELKLNNEAEKYMMHLKEPYSGELGFLFNPHKCCLDDVDYSRPRSKVEFNCEKYSLAHSDYGADYSFTSEQNELMDRAIEAVAKLQLSGVSLEVIKKLLVPKVPLSTIVITERFKILLPDYDKEIKMGPLPKTIFLFFLKHNRSFMFSDLMDYKEELISIYGKISNRDDKEKMRESIGMLVDPFNNSISEKCFAVRKAFLLQITYDVARNYFIEGRQGEPKRIKIDRSLVDWRVKL